VEARRSLAVARIRSAGLHHPQKAGESESVAQRKVLDERKTNYNRGQMRKIFLKKYAQSLYQA
jgi:hypothetical protein